MNYTKEMLTFGTQNLVMICSKENIYICASNMYI